MKPASETRHVAWGNLTYEQKNQELYLKEKETLALFLEHGAITKDQYKKSLHDLSVKMDIKLGTD